MKDGDVLWLRRSKSGHGVRMFEPTENGQRAKWMLVAAREGMEDFMSGEKDYVKFTVLKTTS